jgi:hypothetical protein
MNKLIALNVSRMRLDDLEGIVFETICTAELHPDILNSICLNKLEALIAKNDAFCARLNKSRASLLTPKISEKDEERDRLFAEIKRTAKIGRSSIMPAVAAAGTRLVDFLRPFQDIYRAPIMSQTVMISLLLERYNADPAIIAAVDTLKLTDIMQLLAAANSDLNEFYSQRLTKASESAGPSPSTFKNELAKAYGEFCTAVSVTLSALPSDGLRVLFNQLNTIRRQYIFRQPVSFRTAHTFTMPIALQAYTGKAITPIPRVFVGTGDEATELVFSQDFTVTYRENTAVGEARIIIRGKGKYRGTHQTSFYIVET